jgi:AcrR family transcriptional regulator
VSPRRVVVGRRERPAKAPLSREAVVAAGLRVMRAEGLERLTMRRLAAELDTGAASLYVYVDNMAELHGALLDELLDDVPLPAIEADGWRDAVIKVLSDYTRMLWNYPSLARSVLALHPSGPRYLRLIDCLLGLLAAGGVPTKAAAWGVDPLIQLATATAAEQGTRNESAESVGEEQHLAMAVREAEAADYPHIADARGELFSGTGEERLRWYFGLLLTGISAGGEPGDRER